MFTLLCSSTPLFLTHLATSIVSPKFSDVPLGIGGWPLGYKKRWWLVIVRAISFQDFQPTCSWSTNVTDGQKDGRTDDMQSQYRALHYSASRGKNQFSSGALNRTPSGGAYVAPPDPLVGWEGNIPAHTLPPRRLDLDSVPTAPRFLGPTDKKFWIRLCSSGGGGPNDFLAGGPEI